MFENDTFGTGVAHALDHTRVIHIIREENAAWQF